MLRAVPMIELDPEILDFLRALARGDGSVAPWREFTARHAVALERALTRGRWLTLRFKPGEALPPLLDELGIAYDRRVLDRLLGWADRGMSFQPTLGDPYRVRALYRAGETERGDAKLYRALRRLARRAEDVERGQSIGETVLDAEALLDAGQLDEALGMLLAVARLERGDDLIDPAVDHAEDVLARLWQRSGLASPRPGPAALVAALRGR